MNTNVGTRTYSLNTNEGEARWWMGGLAIIKASGKDTGGQFSLVEVVEHEGVEAPLHVHHNEDEAFWILEGSLTFEVGDKTIKAESGSFLFGPKDIPHRYKVDKGPARLLFIISPSGFEELIRETSESAPSLTLPPPPDGPPTDEEMASLIPILQKYNCEILG
jgi:quercetin dioxygenase-like cupin family protein